MIHSITVMYNIEHFSALWPDLTCVVSLTRSYTKLYFKNIDLNVDFIFLHSGVELVKKLPCKNCLFFCRELIIFAR